ncbi:MAG: hypothetical protein JWM89_462 [Acidimicrobiales bacterium]|nr:hypothetical protein [Acidimicrobiales bacterium]
MDIAITGASGFIGNALQASLRADGHGVVAVSRSAGGGDTIRWDPATGTIDGAGLEGLDAVVHLAGEGIASGPWTAKQRRRIHDSRSQGTDLLAHTLAGLQRPPAVLLSGSAVGAYGDRGDEVLTETSARGDDFLATVCRDWEEAAAPAAAAGIRVANLRTGVVLARKGGAFGKQLPIFKLGLGGRAGDGTQWFPWIALEDDIAAIRFLLAAEISGPVNLVAPQSVTNAEFTKALGRVLHRPTVIPVPRLVRHLPLGIGDLLGSLLFTSQRVQPAALTAAGFTFARPDLDGALASIIGSRGPGS